MSRVAVFVDYNNVYRGARAAFEPITAPHWAGQVNPLAVADELASRGGADRQLVDVRVYKGMPDSTRDPKGHGACSRQLDSFSHLRDVHVTFRPLRYPGDWPNEKPQEKGIDVELSVDFVLLAVQDSYDVGIIFSGDTDLRPALRAVEDLRGRHAIEVAAWQPPRGNAPRLSVGKGKHQRPVCHFLDERVYRAVQDTTDYNKRRPRRRWSGPSG